MLKTFKDKLTRPGQESVESTTTIQAGQDDEPYTTITTTTTTDSFSKQTITDEKHEDSQAKGLENSVEDLAVHDKNQVDSTPTPAEKPSTSLDGSQGVVRQGLKRILETLTRKESTTTTTIREQPQGLTIDSEEATTEVSVGVESPEPTSTYPKTINAKFVKEQSQQQNVDGLKHALSASIDKSSAKQESGKLFEGGILTSANHKKWYHATIPINWVQKLSSEHHFGNYVVSDRENGTKTWEDMPIYARIGMHLLFASMFDHKLLNTHRIQHLFSVESVNQGKHFDAPESVAQIPHFIKTYKLDLSELLQPDIAQYKNFNEFFSRKLKTEARPVHELQDPNIVVSAADCRLCVFESITTATEVWVKGKSFSVQQLVRDKDLAAEFDGGSIGLFRLAPQDYHRFHSPVQGAIAKTPVKIDGTYFTVNPMAVNENLDVFTENVRKVSVIDLDQSDESRNKAFDKCVFISIGALLVGSIELTGAQEVGNHVKKGDELGYFAYGGSTCILLFKKGAVEFDQDLIESSKKGVETLVKMGERIGDHQSSEPCLDKVGQMMPKITEFFSQIPGQQAAENNKQMTQLQSRVNKTIPLPGNHNRKNNRDTYQDELDEESYDEDAAIQQAVKESLKSAPRNSSAAASARNKKDNGKNSRQYIDPWMSEEGGRAPDLISQNVNGASGDRGVSSRRISFGKNTQEPFRLMSTSPGFFRDESHRPRFASPRRPLRSTEPTEIVGSDDEELCVSTTDTNHRAEGRQKGIHQRSKIASPPSRGRRRIVQPSESNTINLISSGEDEPVEQSVSVRHKATPVILRDSSDDDDVEDEISKDPGKDLLKENRSRKRVSVYPTACDTIPRSASSPSATATSTSPVGTAKMPWSITEGPEGDIVLSTPKSKQRIRHYDMVQGSEDDDESEVEIVSEQWPHSHRHSSVGSNHLGLPKIDSIGGVKPRDSPARALVSDSEGEQEEGIATTGNHLRKNDSTTVNTNRIGSRAAISPPNALTTSRLSTKLTKPRRLVLDLPSDLDSSQDLMMTELDSKEVEESHKRLRETLLFEEEEDSEIGTPTPQPMIERISKKIPKEASPPPTFPIFQRLTQQASTKTADEDVAQAQESEVEYEEPLEDPRIRRRSARMSMTSPPKRIKLTEAVPRFSEPAEPMPAPSPIEEIEGFSDESQRVRPVIQQEDRSRQRYSGLRFVDLSKHRMESSQQWPSELAISESVLQPFVERVSPEVEASPIVCSGKPMERCPLCSVIMPADELATHVEAELQAKDREEQDEIERQDQEMALELERAFQTQDAHFEEDQGDFFQTQVPDREPPSTQRRRQFEDRAAGANPITPTKVNIGQRQRMVSLDTPTRQVGNMTLNSPTAVKQRDHDKNVGLRKTISSGVSSDEPDSQIRGTDPIEISQGDSISSQSVFGIQPGQKIVTPAGTQSSSRTVPAAEAADAVYWSHASYPPAPYFSTRQVKSKRALDSGSSSRNFLANGKALASFAIEEDEVESKENMNDRVDDDDDGDEDDDFMQHPGPTLQNRLSRVKLTKTAAKVSVLPSKQKSKEIKAKIHTKNMSEGAFIQLDDTEDEMSSEANHKPAEPFNRQSKAKPKSTILDNILPTSARQRRQQMLKEQRERTSSAKARKIVGEEENEDLEYEIEVGRRRPVSEKLWNKEDDLFDSEKLDHRQVRGVGLGGVVGGIGAIPGKLTMSKVTKTATQIPKPLSQTPDMASSPRVSRDRQHSGGGSSTNGQRSQGVEDLFESPQGYEFDPDYGFQSQDWWEEAQASNGYNSQHIQPRFDKNATDRGGVGAWDDKYEEGDEDEEDFDDGDLLEDLVDLRTGRDDPSLAMYFAQLQPNRKGGNNNNNDDDDDGKESRSKGKGRGRGRGSGRSNGRGKQGTKGQLTFGAGVGPMSLGRLGGAGSSSSAGPPPSTGFSLEAFGHISQSAGPRGEEAYGVRKPSFGGQPTTANGSLAVRSKPTERSTRGGGGGGKSRGRNFWATRARGRGGRGRGRGRGGA
ncbi:hypothetical protein BGZ83_007451 [Gryganskiella cystojenkinii]|nr:hypothetical protein BGZ83_007451 [Gryganskiella cystojenkinii]